MGRNYMSTEKKKKCLYCDNETRNDKFCDFCGKPIQEEPKWAFSPNATDPLGKPEC
jgi:predicted amidophosphoribosyltransferase